MAKFLKSILIALFIFSFSYSQNFLSDNQTAVQYNNPKAVKTTPKSVFKFKDSVKKQQVKRDAVTLRINVNTGDTFDWAMFTNSEFIDPSTGTWTNNHTIFTITINAGTYDFVAQSFDHTSWIIKEGINITSDYTMNVNWSTDPSLTINMAGVDESNNPLSTYTNEYTFTAFGVLGTGDTPFEMGYIFNMQETTTYKISPVSNRYKIQCEEFQPDITNNQKLYCVQYPLLNGLSHDTTLANLPTDYVEQTAKVNNIYADPCYVFFSHSVVELDGGGFNFSYMIKDSAITNWQVKMYLTPVQGDKLMFGSSVGWFLTMYGTPMYPGFNGQVLFVNDGGVSPYYTYYPPTPDTYKSPARDTMQCGMGAPYEYCTGFNNYPTSNYVGIGSNVGFSGATKEYRIADKITAPYKLYDPANAVVGEGAIGSFSGYTAPSAGIYKLETTDTLYIINGIKGKATITQKFDLGQTDATSPLFMSYRIENSQNIHVDKLKKAEAGKVVFAAGDYYLNPDPNHLGYTRINNDSTKVWYKKSGTTVWQSLDVTNVTEDPRVGIVYNAAIPSSVTSYDSAEVDLKLYIVDQAGNSTEMIYEPAFSVRTDGTPVELTNFTASVENNIATLRWATATETNNRGFEVEKKENNTWNKIGFVAGNGTSTQAHTYTFNDMLNSAKASYRLKQIDFDGTITYSNEVEAGANVPVNYALSQNYPNPFNPTTNISFSLPVDANVTIKLYNTLGEEVATLLNGENAAGIHQVIFNASNFTSGVYFYSIEANGKDNTYFKSVKKMMLLK